MAHAFDKLPYGAIQKVATQFRISANSVSRVRHLETYNPKIYKALLDQVEIRLDQELRAKELKERAEQQA